MKDRIITFETAKLAKEKGFEYDKSIYDDLESYAYGLWEYIKNHVNEEYILTSAFYLDFNHNGDQYVRGDSYPAPTQSLLQKWLREKHNMQINTFPYNTGKWEFIIFFLDQPMRGRDGFKNKMSLDVEPYKWDSHEQALEQGLVEALKRIPKTGEQ